MFWVASVLLCISFSNLDMSLNIHLLLSEPPTKEKNEVDPGCSNGYTSANIRTFCPTSTVWEIHSWHFQLTKTWLAGRSIVGVGDFLLKIAASISLSCLLVSPHGNHYNGSEPFHYSIVATPFFAYPSLNFQEWIQTWFNILNYAMIWGDSGAFWMTKKMIHTWLPAPSSARSFPFKMQIPSCTFPTTTRLLQVGFTGSS